METYLGAAHEKKYTIQEVREYKEEENRIESTALTYSWYMCQYAAEHTDAKLFMHSSLGPAGRTAGYADKTCRLWKQPVIFVKRRIKR